MKLETEFPYNEYNGYIVTNKENRKHVCLVHKETKKRTTISYARYLMSVHEKRILNKDEHVDHKDNDKTNDIISNLQILHPSDNNKKRLLDYDIKETIIDLICPICGVTFKRTAQRVRFKLNKGVKPCCSRKCGGKYSHINKK